MNSVRSLPLAVAFVSALALLGLAACSEEPERRGGGGPPPVRVATVEMDEFVTAIEALGTTSARESITVTSQITDIVRSIGFEDGQEVRAGQVLIRLGGGEEPARLREARVNLDRQIRELDRIKGLVAQNLVPAQALDSQLSLLREAEAQVEAASARAGERIIHAPFDGVLGLRRVSPGALVTPGTPITTLDDISVIHLDFTVPETFITAIAVGQEIEATSRAFAGRTFIGLVTQVDTRIDPATRAVTVRADIPNDDRLLRPGMLLLVKLISDRSMALALPEAALVSLRDEHFVFVVDDEETVARRAVTIGRRDPGRVEVVDGLAAGERVVVEGTHRVSPGGRVRVQGTVGSDS